MWIFTKYGFFSAVCARTGDGRHGQPVDTERIMVRARVKKHIEALKERFPKEIGDCDIFEDHNTDYAFRMFVNKAVWVRVLAATAEETDYDNFKSKVARQQGPDGAPYEHALHEVWAVMYRLQH